MATTVTPQTVSRRLAAPTLSTEDAQKVEEAAQKTHRTVANFIAAAALAEATRILKQED